jgi:hypothetical protein
MQQKVKQSHSLILKKYAENAQSSYWKKDRQNILPLKGREIDSVIFTYFPIFKQTDKESKFPTERQTNRQIHTYIVTNHPSERQTY